MSESPLDLEEIVARTIRLASAAGASAADANAVEIESSATGVRLGEVETVQMSRQRRLGLRCFAGKASAVASTADFGDASLHVFVADVVAMARAVAPDDHAGLPGEELLATDHRDFAALELDDPTGMDLSLDARIDWALRCERAALAVDPRLDNSHGADLSMSCGRVAYASSTGFTGSYPSTAYSLSVSPVARDAHGMQRDHWYDTARALAHLAAPEAIGRIAAERTLRRLGARPVSTRQVPVVFDPETAAGLIGHLAGAISGGPQYRRTSFLLDRCGSAVAARGVTIVDDGRLPRGLGSRPFDGEGVATRRTVVVEDGVLRSYLLDTYAARRLGLATTGNASRGIGDSPASAPSNIFLMPGTHTPEEIIASVKDGLYVTSLSGPGVNGVTGDYSRGAAGLWIENGRIAFPVEQITIAGNLRDMLTDIEMIGADLHFRGRVNSPTVKIKRMTVAGQ